MNYRNRLITFIKKYYDYLSDEIKMLKNSGQTYQDRKRYKSILLAQSDNYNVAILDDGFQDFSIKPDFYTSFFNYGTLCLKNGKVQEGLSLLEKAKDQIRCYYYFSNNGNYYYYYWFILGDRWCCSLGKVI